MSGQYTPKVGDRVRATRTIEGEVTLVVHRDISKWREGRLDLQTSEGLIELHDDDEWTFEKLVDPEPDWVSGDVISAGGGVYARIGLSWVDVVTGKSVLSNLIWNYWERGAVEILHRAGS